jgi:hypothetical protein
MLTIFIAHCAFSGCTTNHLVVNLNRRALDVSNYVPADLPAPSLRCRRARPASLHQIRDKVHRFRKIELSRSGGALVPGLAGAGATGSPRRLAAGVISPDSRHCAGRQRPRNRVAADYCFARPHRRPVPRPTRLQCHAVDVQCRRRPDLRRLGEDAARCCGRRLGFRRRGSSRDGRRRKAAQLGPQPEQLAEPCLQLRRRYG